MNLWDSLNAVGKLLPPALLVEEMTRHGIEEVRVAPLLGLLAICDVDTGIITLAPDIDREKVAQRFSRLWCCLVDPRDVYLCILWHEIGHFKEKDRLRKDPSHWEVRQEAEISANEFARKRFEEWKRGQCK